MATWGWFLSRNQLDQKMRKMMANNLMRFDPVADLARFDPFRNLDELFRDFALAPRWRDAISTPQICMDVAETEHDYQIKADIPGVQKDQIKVSVDGKQVSINVQVAEEKKVDDGGLFYRERSYGQQYRNFVLPQEVDDSQAQAKYEDGVLLLTLPKKAGAGSKQLSIK